MMHDDYYDEREVMEMGTETETETETETDNMTAMKRMVRMDIMIPRFLPLLFFSGVLGQGKNRVSESL